MSAPSTETCDVFVPPPALIGMGVPANYWPDDQPWFDHAAVERMLALDVSAVSGRLIICASSAGAAASGLTGWPTTSHAIIRWSRAATPCSGVLRYASAQIRLMGETEPATGILSFLSPRARPRSEKLEALIARITGFGDLHPDWAGGEAETITAATIGAAMRVADAAERAGLPLPQASPSAEGEIGLSWYRGRDRFALTIEPDMHAVWATSINRKVEEGDAVEVGSPSFPGLIVEALRGFYGASAGEVPV